MQKHPLDKGSFWLIVITFSLFVFAALYDTFVLHWQFFQSLALFYLGLVIFSISVLLRLIGKQTLGRNFSVFVAVQEKHHLVTTGVYKYVRHPVYTAGILTALGILLMTQSILATIVFFVVLFPALLYRIHVEEDMLVAVFGKEYLDYKKKVRALIPWVI